MQHGVTRCKRPTFKRRVRVQGGNHLQEQRWPPEAAAASSPAAASPRPARNRGGRGGSQKQRRERDAGAGHVALDGCLLWRVYFHEVSAGGRVQLRRDCGLCSVEPLGGESDEAHGLANDEKGG